MRHLDEQRQATAERVELILAVELLQLLGLALRVIGVASPAASISLGCSTCMRAVAFVDLRSSGVRSRRIDDHQDDDRQAPVDSETAE